MRYVFVDLETTGLQMPEEDPEKFGDEIIQIAAIATGPAPDFKELERIDLKVWPSEYGIDRIRVLTKEGFPVVYDEDVWASKGSSRPKAFASFQQFLRRYSTVTKVSKAKKVPYKVAQLVGYNVDFDKEFLFRSYKRAGIFLPARGIGLDVMGFIGWLDALDDEAPLQDSMKLTDICRACGVKLNNAHNAMADIEATVELTRVMVRPLFS